MSKLFVDIALPVAVDQLFTYNVPSEIQQQIEIGKRAIVPFGKKTLTGFIVKISETTSITRLKDIIDILDAEPLISEEMLKLTKWISDYYFAPWGEVLKSAVPQKTLSGSKKIITLNPDVSEEAYLKIASARKQKEILQLLFEKKEISLSQLQNKLKIKSTYSILNELTKKNLITISEKLPTLKGKPKYEKFIHITEESKNKWNDWLNKYASENNKRAVKQINIINFLNGLPINSSISIKQLIKESKGSLSSLKTLEQSGVISISEQEVKRILKFEPHQTIKQNIIINESQKLALEQIQQALNENIFKTFLLHGITGSGKTQVYIEAIRFTLSRGKTAIVLVPEISLTPQTVSRFQMYFGEMVGVFHSRMSLGERHDAWRLTKSGKYSIVIGPRSAIFAPLDNLGLIVVDEEHESSYKQFDQTPRYNARDVAVMRAFENNAVVVLGSATPSIDSYYNALTGKYTLLNLPDRVDNAKLPEIEIVDMTNERQKLFEKFRAERKEEFEKDPVAARLSKRKPEFSSISELLKEKILDRIEKKEGIILLQNRRGFSSFIECLDCGYVEMCSNCNVSLTYHIIKKHLRCHYCGLVKSPPEVCPNCSGVELDFKGFGTQRVEEELQLIFPNASIVRMDLDTTTKKGSHDKILRQFASGDIDILLGTQMVAKGLDFSHVTLVGVISADIQMLLPDFRSAERTFQLLTQVAGRAGRSELLKGEVVIQTFQPNHYSLRHVVTHDFVGFYSEEINNRKELNYPPFSRIALIEIKGQNETEVIRHANKIFELLISQNTNLKYLGPAEAAIPKLKKFYRWHILIKDIKSKDPSGKMLRDVLMRTIKKYMESQLGKSRAVKVIVDVDPVGMM